MWVRPTFLTALMYLIAPAAPNKGIQRSAKSGRPLMPGVRHETEGGMRCWRQ